MRSLRMTMKMMMQHFGKGNWTRLTQTKVHESFMALQTHFKTCNCTSHVNCVDYHQNLIFFFVDNANENLHLDLEKLNQENETEDNNGQQQEDEIIAVDGNDTGEDANATENTNEAQPPAPPEDVPRMKFTLYRLLRFKI